MPLAELFPPVAELLLAADAGPAEFPPEAGDVAPIDQHPEGDQEGDDDAADFFDTVHEWSAEDVKPHFPSGNGSPPSVATEMTPNRFKSLS